MPQLPDPFHEGERSVQERLGLAAAAAANAPMLCDSIGASVERNIVRGDIAVLTTRVGGRLRMDVCSGPTGFVEAVGPSRVRLHCDHELPVSLLAGVSDDPRVGGVTVGFATRQRARINGMAHVVDQRTLDIALDEVFTNCTKYITTRTHGSGAQTRRHHGAEMAVARTDIFFIGSYHPDRGLDASHRGGEPGFVSFDGVSLEWAEFKGNDMFQTIGNLVASGETAIIVPDLETGEFVHLHGTASVEFSEATRIVVTVDHVESGSLATMQRWVPVARSPHNPPSQPA